MPLTTIVNLKDSKCEIRIDRTSPFGNRYEIGVDGDREQVIAKYRIWFYKKLTDPSFRDKVLSLKSHVLGCWCKPLNCHGDVILEYLEGIPYGNKHTNAPTTDFIH